MFQFGYEKLAGVARWIGAVGSASRFTAVAKLANFKEVFYFTLAWSDLFLLLFLVTLKSVDDGIQDLVDLKRQFNPVFLFL